MCALGSREKLDSRRKPQAAAPEARALFTCVCRGCVAVWGALAWQGARGRLPAPDSGPGRSPSVSSGPNPALGIYFFLPPVTRCIEVASEVEFSPFISNTPATLSPSVRFPLLAAH